MALRVSTHSSSQAKPADGSWGILGPSRGVEVTVMGILRRGVPSRPSWLPYITRAREVAWTLGCFMDDSSSVSVSA